MTEETKKRFEYLYQRIKSNQVNYTEMKEFHSIVKLIDENDEDLLKWIKTLEPIERTSHPNPPKTMNTPKINFTIDLDLDIEEIIKQSKINNKALEAIVAKSIKNSMETFIKDGTLAKSIEKAVIEGTEYLTMKAFNRYINGSDSFIQQRINHHISTKLDDFLKEFVNTISLPKIPKKP